MNNYKQKKKEYDVVVCGGGIAGTSAALVAARQGSKGAFFEKNMYLAGWYSGVDDR